jgi:protein associated with RNAse G/E
VTTDRVHVEKRKWDGSLAAVEVAELVRSSPEATVWRVSAGTERQQPRKGRVEVIDRDELWLSVAGAWWVLCAQVSGGVIDELVLHAAAPFAPTSDSRIEWIDLDLDFEVRGDDLSLEDEAEFHAHARSMAYPDEIVRGAWSGISAIAARYTTGEWPFDGFLDSCLADSS